MSARCHRAGKKAGMTSIWSIVPSFKCAKYQRALEDEEPPRFQLINRNAIFEVWCRFLEGSEYEAYSEADLARMEFDAMPWPVFRIADPAFRLDYFQVGRLCCLSLRLREALGLSDDVIRYREIDLLDSPPAVHAQEYRAFEVVHHTDPIDWSRTPSEILEYQRADGSTSRRRVLAHPLRRPHTYWRENFTPPAPLFRALSWLMATDELADRVMRAGITDVLFQDITSDSGQTKFVRRKL
jgi:hypothetical protein